MSGPRVFMGKGFLPTNQDWRYLGLKGVKGVKRHRKDERINFDRGETPQKRKRKKNERVIPKKTELISGRRGAKEEDEKKRRRKNELIR